ncbi:MAG: sigma-70 family RNA polymerase sigma factor [Bacteroidota bacterium]
MVSPDPSSSANVCEEATFDRLFLQHAALLRNFCLYRCKDLVQAEDYVQEAFLRLWKNCAKVPYPKARSFLFKVAQNLFLHQVEHQKVVHKYLRWKPKTVQVQGPEFALEEKELHARVEAAIEALSEKQRVVFLLHKVDGKSYKEIATMLEISVKSVEKRMHRALLALRQHLPQL